MAKRHSFSTPPLSGYFAQALNSIAEVIATQDDTWSLLQETSQSTGQVLDSDRVVIYDVSFPKGRLEGLHEWLNPERGQVEDSIGNYPLQLFYKGAETVWEEATYLISNASQPHPSLILDGSAGLLHGQMNIKTLLWYPFAFREDGFYLLILNQVFQERAWQQEEIDFLQAVSNLVSIALNKIKLMQEREELLQNARKHNEELSRLNEAMAHHFQEPTRRLVTYAQQLERNPQLQEDPASQLAVGFIVSQAQRLSELVRAAQKYLAVDQLPSNLQAQADTQQVFFKACEAAGLDGKACIKIQGKLPPVRMAAKDLLTLFQLMLCNAWQYRHPARPLEIQLEACCQEQRVTFYLADNGVGIAPDYREKVFSLFTRLVCNDQQGCGLGLALARKLLDHYEGHIHLEDGLEGGSCLVFNLPLAKDEEPDLQQPQVAL
ncbi:ATP-binding protein [Marinospirillum perlucidum]|uniref:ATP-binding protein n=1 Tax=Marinospirillum perlucidum TaxID=1982602 RepID=UPI000DF17AFE|nr:ATP-binding protein [Marinospirillum perlucidum]